MDDKELLLLIDKLQSNSITAEERNRLEDLLRNPDELEKFTALMELTFEKTQRSSSKLAQYDRENIVRKRLEQHIPFPDLTKRKLKRSRIIYWVSSVAAACIILSFIIFSGAEKIEEPSIVWETISTVPGERRKVSLSDGTKIVLNGNTSLSYPKHISEKLRLVKLKGEAFFDVANNEHKPFLIISEDFTTQVVGTSFNIDTDIGKVVEVNTGQVNVFAMEEQEVLTLTVAHNISKEEVLAQISQNATHHVTLTKGLRAQLGDNTQWTVENYRYKNWLDNELIHLNEPVLNVVQKAYRNFGDSIVVHPELAHKKITITFRERTKEQVLHTLAELANGKLTLNHETNTWEIMK